MAWLMKGNVCCYPKSSSKLLPLCTLKSKHFKKRKLVNSINRHHVEQRYIVKSERYLQAEYEVSTNALFRNDILHRTQRCAQVGIQQLGWK